MDVKKALVTFEKDVDVDAQKLLHFLSGVTKNSPKAVAALAVMIGGFSKVLEDTSSAAENPSALLAQQFDASFWTDLKACWPELQSFAADFGIKV